jgi:ABC-type uncharacterized transport system YnjBCD ATPase subunit
MSVNQGVDQDRLDRINAADGLPAHLTVIDRDQPEPSIPPRTRAGRRVRELVDEILLRSTEPLVDLTLSGGTLVTVRTGATVSLIGATGAGKSSLAVSLMLTHARDIGPAVSCSIELPGDEQAARMIGTARGASWLDVLTGRVPRDHMLMAIPDRLSIIDREHATLDSLEKEIEAMRKEHPSDPMLCGVDYVQLVVMDSASADRAERLRVGDVMRRLDRIARQHRVVMLALSQGSRASARGLTSGERIGADTTDAGAESADIERWATVTLAIGGRGDPSEDGSIATSLEIGKSRMGAGDRSIPARYDGRTGLWTLTGESRLASDVRAERQDAKTEAQVAIVMLALRGAIGKAAGPLSDRQLAQAVPGRFALRRQARARLLADPESGIVQCGRASGGRTPAYPIWTRDRATAAGLAIHGADEEAGS